MQNLLVTSIFQVIRQIAQMLAHRTLIGLLGCVVYCRSHKNLCFEKVLNADIEVNRTWKAQDPLWYRDIIGCRNTNLLGAPGLLVTSRLSGPSGSLDLRGGSGIFLVHLDSLWGFELYGANRVEETIVQCSGIKVIG